ncbi:hypothetical protein HRbin11_01880 [bacterium HR11]|nr:hypothetical protein HRbin11_01880 [bacterium HR11]
MGHSPVRSYRELRVWQTAMTLAAEVYRLTRAFPREERFGMTAQARQAAVSVAANIAEGYGRESLRDYIRFLRVAQGSLKELETHLLLCIRVGLLDEAQARSALESCDRLGRMIHRLIQALRRWKAHHSPPGTA